ncbi:MAG: fructose-1,6-bisphosphatase [Acutalibacteraceae bacterium]|nr:fructose-1,6-bisphosphatase [Clostridia bacterium]MEE1291944.1 fructose-1,6-bisphosphatase [Acutalibacteraceae bacterium]NLD29462.1 fructose-1,6-bisphosphatase [Clostridiales bacterium]MBQ1530032.1 fructose-1,6-bisphosphatase [Clostridia bacterium]MBQ5580980.1 fructose-1,6-bisphosphatase [Clostridia bacterium]
MSKKKEYSQAELEYLRLLGKEYPTEQSAATEIINLNAILNLPKATEHFMSDVHGEYEPFVHVMNSASGAIREKIDALFADTLTADERDTLATIVYYPEEKMKELLETAEDETAFYHETLHHLIELTHVITSKYTRSKVRKALPPEYAYVIDELINIDFDLHNKKEYYDNILNTIIEIGKAQDFIAAVCSVIKRLIVDRLHLVGDIFDRGPRADIVMDALMEHHSLDIQFGNHDVVWIGAAAGSPICIATVLSNSILYNNLPVLEIGYGISLRPLSLFANEYYALTDLSSFATRILDKEEKKHTKNRDLLLTARMSKAITMILFKLMGQVVKRNPDFDMMDRASLEHINYDDSTVEIDGKVYPMKDCDFPTVDPEDPYTLTAEEQDMMNEMVKAFRGSEKLQKHVRFLLDKGSMYKCYNGNLLVHGGVPMNADGTFKVFNYEGKEYSGKALLDYCDKKVRDGYFAADNDPNRQRGQDFMWFLWCGKWAPTFAREKITTFERRFIADKSTWTEARDPYYQITQTAEGCKIILHEFGLDTEFSHIINGHTPVKTTKGETPIRGEGKLFLIDGGFSKAYQKTTGIAGYSLIFNSHGMRISALEPFEGFEDAVHSNKDIIPETVLMQPSDHRIKIYETDIGKKLKKNIDMLTRLMDVYRRGILPEHPDKLD